MSLLGDPFARDARLASALGLPVRAPDLQRFGFRLASMQLFAHGAQLRYADRDPPRPHHLRAAVQRNGPVRHAAA